VYTTGREGKRMGNLFKKEDLEETEVTINFGGAFLHWV